MDLPLTLDSLTYIIIVVLVTLFLVILYEFRLKPQIQLPLSSERDLGIGRVSLPKQGRPLVEGRITTALHYVQGAWAKIITSADKKEQPGLLELRDAMMKGYFIAQRTGRDKIIYLCDVNPCDETYSIRQDKRGSTPIWFIPTQDSISHGSYDGFEWVGIKIGKATATFEEDERKSYDILVGALSFLRIASVNIGKIKSLEDRNKSVEDLLTKEHEEHAKTRSKLDRALSALEQKTLSTTGEAKLPSNFMATLKTWFTWPQLITAAAFYFIVSPLLMSSFFSTATPPTTTYITAFIAVIGFFSIPFFKKVFGRWL